VSRQPPSGGHGKPAPAVLADRIAASLLDHDPGWRLPRRSDLARKHQVTIAEIDAAISQLAGRHLVRELADGQVYVASPAEYLITLDHLSFPGSRIDPMGTPLSCASRDVLRRAVPDGTASALRLGPGERACAVQTTWKAARETAAVATTYLPARLAGPLAGHLGGEDGPGSGLNPVPAPQGSGVLARPAAFYLEVRQPPHWAGRMLRLGPADPAIIVTVRLDDPATRIPVALTVAILHPAHFRIAVEAFDDHAGSLPQALSPR
jgi:DNA-binding GntR family transcriptional regulator